MRILLVEDDRHLRDSVSRGLRAAGIETLVAGTFAEASERLLFATHDVVVLDVMLPGGSGFDLCRLMRDRGIASPVLMLTARDSVADRVHGLDMGADDYLTKPFALDELLARVRALGRRSVALLPEHVRIANLEVEMTSRRVSRGGVPIELTAKEFDLLEFFVRHEGAVVSRAAITSRVWDENHDPFANALEALIRRLRVKIDEGFHPRLVHTVRGAGYRFGTGE